MARVKVKSLDYQISLVLGWVYVVIAWGTLVAQMTGEF